VQPYPSDEQLQDQLQRHEDWLSFRKDIVRQSLAEARRSHAHRMLMTSCGNRWRWRHTTWWSRDLELLGLGTAVSTCVEYFFRRWVLAVDLDAAK